jgi:hypothetical protein
MAYSPPTGIPILRPAGVIASPSARTVPPMQKVGIPTATTASSSFTNPNPSGNEESRG